MAKRRIDRRETVKDVFSKTPRWLDSKKDVAELYSEHQKKAVRYDYNTNDNVDSYSGISHFELEERY